MAEPKKPLPETVMDNPPRKKDTTPKKAKASGRTKKRAKKSTSSSSTPAQSRGLILAIVGGIGVLVVLFYGLLTWALIQDGGEGTTLATLGLQAGEVKSLLLGMTNGVFGLVALGCFVALLVSLFRWFMLSPKAKTQRKQMRGSALWRGVGLVVALVAWVFLYWLINRVEVAAEPTASTQLIQTEPENVVGLQGPVLVAFDIGTELVQRIDASLLRTIRWDFDGDGTFDASGPQVNYEFTAQGRYPVNVEVTYFHPQEQTEKVFATSREVIIANEKVTAVLTPSVSEGGAPLTVEFSALESRDPDGDIIEYAWDFDGDGAYEVVGAEEALVEYTYEEVGTYTATLRVRGTNNDMVTQTVEIVVAPPVQSLTPVINAPEGTTGVAPAVFELDALRSFAEVGRIVRYQWFVAGEVAPRNGQRISVTFRDPGEYPVTLQVTNQDGETAETTQVFTVDEDLSDREVVLRAQPPFADADMRQLVGVAPFRFVLDSSQSTVKDPVGWEWDFDDDGVVDAFDRAVEHVYRETGTYQGRVTITDARGNTYTERFSAEVAPAGTVARIAADPQSGIVPVSIRFDGSGSTTDSGEIITYRWTFPGQEPIEYQSQIEYEFTNVGEFPVKLEIVTSSGATDTEEILVSVRNQPVKADFAASATQGPAPLTVELDPTSTLGTVFSYEWDFGDGRTSTEFQPTYVYRVPGTYVLTLKVTDPRGVVNTKTEVITVAE